MTQDTKRTIRLVNPPGKFNDEDILTFELAKALLDQEHERRAVDADSMIEVHIDQDAGPDISFTGWLIAFADAREAGGKRDADRWTELQVWQTRAGDWIAIEFGFSERERERDKAKATHIPASSHTGRMATAAMQAFGWSWLAKQLAVRSGWSVREIIQ